MKKILSFTLCLWLMCSLPLFAFADEDIEPVEETPLIELKISNTAQFLNLAENCIIDSYSKNLHISLEKNIDLSNTDFDSIPIFCGVFEGNGHTISGFSPNASGSVQGLFRYLTEGAVVKNLNLKGEITPGGSHNQIGGIVGSNAGSILNCSYNGTVSGSSYIGGIAGTNKVSGIIDNCSVAGIISGDHFVGGIAGESSGVIRNCHNVALINVSSRENNVSLSDITVDSLTSSEAANTVTDIGGIAGFSNGIIRKCENYGEIGHIRMGYNIGGIAGTQSGYIVDCTNYAEIYGRKEVGGIAGQLEPVSLIEYSEDTLQILEGQLDTMSGLVNQTSYNAQQNSVAVNDEIAVLQDQTSLAADAIDVLLYGDKTDTDSIIAAENTLSSTMSAMPETFGNLAVAAGNTVVDLTNDLQAISGQIDAMSETINNASETLGIKITDVSDEDTDEDFSGKIEASVNLGCINGDNNVGGIAGAISMANDLDLLEDLQQSGNNSLNIESKMRAVVLRCENKALVSGSKQSIGGIVGLQTMGLVKSSGNTAFVDALSAEFVGGVSGQSHGFIRDCFAKCIISAKSSVGGIAGSATIVTDCRSLVDIQDADEKQGAILGIAAETDSEIENPIFANLYMSPGKDIGAIDGISYDGLAQAVSKYEFFSLEDLPDVFRQLELRFAAEGHKAELISLKTGDSLPFSRIPVVPQKPGYTGVWEGIEDFDFSAVYFDAEFNALYEAKDSVISSMNENSQGKPTMLAQGIFPENDHIRLYNCSFEVELPYAEKLVFSTRYDCGENADISTIRCLIPENLSSFKVYTAKDDNSWRETEHSIDGSYIVVDTESGDNRIAIVKCLDLKLLSVLAAVLFTVVFISLFVIIIIKKRKKQIV